MELLDKYKKQEDKILIANILDKIKFVQNRNCIENTDFLDIRQQQMLTDFLKSIKYKNYIFYGGYEQAERKTIVLLPDKLMILEKQEKEKLYDNIISVININFGNTSSSQNLLHNQYLGGLIKLGIKREKIGDILVNENDANIIILNNMVKYVTLHIKDLRRFNKAEIQQIETKNLKYIEKKKKNIIIIVSKLRADCIVSKLLNCSRQKSEEIIKNHKVILNYEVIDKNSIILKTGDTLTIRGKGKFIIGDILNITKKDRITLEVQKF